MLIHSEMLINWDLKETLAVFGEIRDEFPVIISIKFQILNWPIGWVNNQWWVQTGLLELVAISSELYEKDFQISETCNFSQQRNSCKVNV